MQASSQHKPSLEGIRGIAFLLVFAVHYSGPALTLQRRPLHQWPWFLVCFLSYSAVPMFFALSGYLITKGLYETRSKQGFLRVFYLRRLLRVFPLYFVTLILALTMGVLTGGHWNVHDLLFLSYLYNLHPDQTIYSFSPVINVGHFWSLAVEEQFYLIWPLILWFFPRRQDLVRICVAVIATSFIARLYAPVSGFSVFAIYENTIVRCDAIMLGALMALYEKVPGFSLPKLRNFARFVLYSGALIIVCRVLVKQRVEMDFFGINVILPVLSAIGASIVLLSLAPGTGVYRLATCKWAVALGKLSYGLYLFHQLFQIYAIDVLSPRLIPYTGRLLARGCCAAIAFIMTLITAKLAYHFIEQPALRYKHRIVYGQDMKEEVVENPDCAVALSRVA